MCWEVVTPPPPAVGRPVWTVLARWGGTISQIPAGRQGTDTLPRKTAIMTRPPRPPQPTRPAGRSSPTLTASDRLRPLHRPPPTATPIASDRPQPTRPAGRSSRAPTADRAPTAPDRRPPTVRPHCDLHRQTRPPELKGLPLTRYRSSRPLCSLFSPTDCVHSVTQSETLRRPPTRLSRSLAPVT